jgi:hypothetical protein
MKLKFSIIIGALSSLVLSSCLKDTAFLDVSNTTPIMQFGLSVATGNPGPFVFAGDSTAYVVPTYDTAIALVLASPQVLNDSVVVTIAIDPTQITAFNTANDDTTNMTLIPNTNGTGDSLYSMPQMTITIPPGYRVGSIPVNIYLKAFPAAHLYGLPLTIVSAVDKENPNNQIIVSGNAGTFMWIFAR